MIIYHKTGVHVAGMGYCGPGQDDGLEVDDTEGQRLVTDTPAMWSDKPFVSASQAQPQPKETPKSKKKESK